MASSFPQVNKKEQKIKEEEHHWEHLFLEEQVPFKVKNSELAVNEHFAPIFHSNSFLLKLKGLRLKETIVP